MPTYEDLVKQVQAASGQARADAFEALIAPFQSIAHSWAYHALGDPQLAQDATQEAFLTAYQKIDQLREPAAFPSWLKRIVLTYCHRQTRRKSPYLLPLDDDDAPALADPAANVEERELKERVTQAVRALPAREREVTELFYITGYSQQEIAERLAVPLTTVKKRLQYAREHLRATMPPMSALSQASGVLDADLLRLIALAYPEMFVLA